MSFIFFLSSWQVVLSHSHTHRKNVKLPQDFHQSKSFTAIVVFAFCLCILRELFDNCSEQYKLYNIAFTRFGDMIRWNIFIQDKSVRVSIRNKPALRARCALISDSVESAAADAAQTARLIVFSASNVDANHSFFLFPIFTHSLFFFFLASLWWRKTLARSLYYSRLYVCLNCIY